MKTNHHNIKGMLAVIILLFILVRPLLLVGSTAFSIDEIENIYSLLSNSSTWSSYKLSIWITVTLVCFISISAGVYLITSRKKSAYYYALVSLWIVGPIAQAIINGIVPYIYFHGTGIGKLITIGIGSFIMIAAGSAFWTVVLLLNENARLRYGLIIPSVKGISDPTDPEKINDGSELNDMDSDQVIQDDSMWIPLKTFTSHEDEFEFIKVRKALTDNGIRHKIQKALIVTVFVHRDDFNRVDSLAI